MSFIGTLWLELSKFFSNPFRYIHEIQLRRDMRVALFGAEIKVGKSKYRVSNDGWLPQTDFSYEDMMRMAYHRRISRRLGWACLWLFLIVLLLSVRNIVVTMDLEDARTQFPREILARHGL